MSAEIWDLKVLQEEQKPWVLHNFGIRPSWMPLLGIFEEVGELSQAMAVHNVTDTIDAISDITIFMSDFCSAMGFDLQELNVCSTKIPPHMHLSWWTYCGRLSHAYLKKAQGIRGTPEQHDEMMKECLVGILVIVRELTSTLGSNFEDTVRKTWEQVRQRDWKKNAQTGAQ